jgi:hypothetical protein
MVGGLEALDHLMLSTIYQYSLIPTLTVIFIGLANTN